MPWSIQISGDPTDLSLLAAVLHDDDVCLEEASTGWLLRSSRFDGCRTASEVHREATQIRELLNGGAFLELGAQTPLSLGPIIEENGTGRHIVLATSAVLRVRVVPPTITVTKADGSVETNRPAAPVQRWFQKARSSPAIASALRLRGNRDLGWVELYRILEVITSDVPLGEIESRGWASNTDLKRFRHTANSVAASGDDARHGIEREQPPRNPMSISDARAFVDGILRNWMNC